MIKQALEYIVGLKGGYDIVEQKGRTYLVDKNGREQKEFKERYQKWLETSTLSSIVDYFRGDPDKVLAGDKHYIIHISSISQVYVYSQVSEELERHNLLYVRANLPDGFPFGRYMDLEQFNIMLQSQFLDTEDRAKLLALTGNVVDESVKSYGDDGVSQKATVKSGVTSLTDVKVPNPVVLKPFRTFAEAEQPTSKFIFRLRKDNAGVTAALFEADGGAWKVQAIANIADYLDEHLTNALNDSWRDRITILA